MKLRFFPALTVGALIIMAASCTRQSAVNSTSSAIPSETKANLAATLTQTAPLPHLNLDEQGRALRGYDPVAYFVENTAVMGSAEFTFEWEGAIWQFTSAENRNLFASAPADYAPANGGYCTFGVVLAKKFDGDPNTWLLHDGQLYVFLNPEVKDKFLQDESGNLAKVNSNWPRIRDKTPAELEQLG